MDVNLVLVKKNGGTRNFPLNSTVTVIGRRQDCDLCVPLMVVSRKHCEINQDQGHLRLRDLGSRNGTLVNGEKINEVDLGPGDRIAIGPVDFGVQINGEPADIANDDQSIIAPPKHLEQNESNVVTEAKEFAGLDDVGTLQGHDAVEILNGIGDEN
jgi:pSer/pThr/pTyr-binding forkhead associated (FHA) protein